ncbi:valine--tRNA ligase [Candidatus Parcubacteria bacterium]|nr:valine--tRNA ligase [Candidatus Parcubacteria bacterium]
MAKNTIPKAYESKQYEDDMYAAWETSGFFNPDQLPGERTESFSIVLPPPNVTGTLHMGHAVMLALEDIMVRFARMRGKRALWVPGTDHAAIATQAKVERLLMKEGMKDPRRELGREAFLKRVEAFAAESHDIIVNQAKKMGASLDWSREAFTLDAQRNRAVNAAFKRMHEDGLIYRGDRIVNWCPRCKSTLADDEVEYREEKTTFYYFTYGPVVIGTARPETKFADKVLIVHPDDARYASWVGKEMEVEWIEGPVMAKVVADEAAEMDMGSGAMTITPAHSFVDFDLAKKYGFDIVKIIDEDGNLTAAAGSFAGKNAHAAREEIVAVLQKKGLVDHVDENYVHNLSVCYRCGEAVEPLPKLQWFIDVNKPFPFRASSHAPMEGVKDGQEVTLKGLMRHVVETGQIEILPDRFHKTYFHWIDNLRDWNISRQLWYGHRVPVWYREGEMQIGEKPQSDGWEQDPDTLDTWFSSGLWTISTLGWPDQTQDLRVYHPTSVLETGYDILFFWVARMILMTTYALGEVPFRHVYLHGLIRDEQGRKMSKSLENIIDPLEMIEKHGADATRLSLVIGTTPGNDTKLSEEKVAAYRNFANKLWNIARYILSSSSRVTPTGPAIGGEAESSLDAQSSREMTLADRWIASRFARVTDEVTRHLERYEFSQAGEKLRDFTWNELADWYLEVSKVPSQQRASLAGGPLRTDLLTTILSDLLKLWHPFMPFVTEALWSHMAIASDDANDVGAEGSFRRSLDSTGSAGLARDDSPVSAVGDLARDDSAQNLLMIQSWPIADLSQKDEQAERDFALLQQAITAIRNIRAQYQIEPKSFVDVRMETTDDHAAGVLEENWEIVQTLAKVKDIRSDAVQGVTAAAILGPLTIHVALPVDPVAERARLVKARDEKVRYIQTTQAKLENGDFVSKAPARVVEEMRAKLEMARGELEGIEKQMQEIASFSSTRFARSGSSQ